jgi:hypothetical protein
LQAPNDDDTHRKDVLDVDIPPLVRRNSSDPHLTIINVDSLDVSTEVQVPVRRSFSSSAKSSQLYSLLNMPNRRPASASTSNSQTLQPVHNTDRKETIVKTLEKSKQGNSNRFLSFIRYIFCRFVPVGSNATVISALNNQTMNVNNNSNEIFLPHTTKQKDDQSKVRMPLKRD